MIKIIMTPAKPALLAF